MATYVDYLGVREHEFDQADLTKLLRHMDDKLKYRSYVKAGIPVGAASRIYKEVS